MKRKTPEKRKMVRLMVVGDIHFQTNNVLETTLLHKRLLDIITNNNVDITVLLGDILHTHEKFHTIAYNNAIKMIYDISLMCEVYVLIGNHDMINNSQFLTDNHPFNALKQWKNVTIVDTYIQATTQDGYTYGFCPYVPNGRFKEALGPEYKLCDYIFAHQEFKKCDYNGIVSVHGDDWDANDPMIVSGHIHNEQHVGKNIYYVGEPVDYSKGISNHVILIDGRDRVRYKIKLNLPLTRLVTLNMSYEELEEFDPQTVGDNEKVKIVVTCKDSEFKNVSKLSKNKTFKSKCIKIVAKTMRLSDNGCDDKTRVVDSGKSFMDLFTQRLKDEDKYDDYVRLVVSTT